MKVFLVLQGFNNYNDGTSLTPVEDETNIKDFYFFKAIKTSGKFRSTVGHTPSQVSNQGYVCPSDFVFDFTFNFIFLHGYPVRSPHQASGIGMVTSQSAHCTARLVTFDPRVGQVFV